MTTITDTLVERQGTHGEFLDNATIAQELKLIAREGKNWKLLGYCQQEALDMILHKIARILNGNPNHKDHWHDIGGYAGLVEERL